MARPFRALVLALVAPHAFGCGLFLETDLEPHDGGPVAVGVDGGRVDGGGDAGDIDAGEPMPRVGTEVYDLTPSAAACPTPFEYDPAVSGCVSYEQGIASISVPVPASISSYTEVWGVVRGAQQQTPDAFDAYYSSAMTATLDDLYVDGVSITTESPRRHVFTLAAALHVPDGPGSYQACPCDMGPPAPSFLGEAWVCETGNNRPDWGYDPSYYDDVLWDADALGGSACTPLGDPGQFHVVLARPASGPLEVRVMQDQSDDAFAVTELRLWVR